MLQEKFDDFASKAMDINKGFKDILGDLQTKVNKNEKNIYVETEKATKKPKGKLISVNVKIPNDTFLEVLRERKRSLKKQLDLDIYT